MIITRTPFRLSFLGGGSDYPQWFNKHGGLCVGGTIDKFNFITVRYLPPYHDYKSRIVYSKIETAQHNADIQHGAVLETIRHLNLEKYGLEILHAADLPGRSGTGSSSAFVVGLLNALSSLQGTRMSPRELADAAIHIEQTRLKETVGCQDQTWAAHGGLKVIRFQRDQTEVLPLTITHDQVDDLQDHLMLFFTGIQRTSSEIAKQYAGTLETKTAEMWAMMRLAEQGIEALYGSQWEKLGQLMDQSWRIKCSLSADVSTEAIHRMYSTARLSGAFGGKIIGSGGGGCLLVVAPQERHQEIIAQLAGEGCVHIPFRFHSSGSSVIFCER